MKVGGIMKRIKIMSMVFFVPFFLFLIILSSATCRLSTMSSICRSDPGSTLWKLKQMSPLEQHSASLVKSSLVSPITCDRSHRNYDICSINGTSVLDPNKSTFYVVGLEIPKHFVEKVRPYPRKMDNSAMGHVKEITLTSGPPSPPCKVQHNVSALVFSAGGYTGNFFHDFNDGFIPLFITVNSVPHKDFVVVISKSRLWWAHKYVDLLRSFSNHPIINLDKDNVTHCFPSVTLGLMSHGIMTIDPKLIPNSRTMLHFHALLEKTYGRGHHPSFSIPLKARPRLILASRSGGIGRVILNQAELEKVAHEEGFDVIVFEPKHWTPLRKAYVLVHSSHVMIGVHGATLTHSLFLRRGSVFMQVVPIGLEWVADAYFGKPARDIGLEYMEYKIGVDESCLVKKYAKNETMLKDPEALKKKGWSIHEIMHVYLKEQNVKLDSVRFRGYLKKAYEKATVFTKKED